MTDLSLIASLWFAMIGFWLIGTPCNSRAVAALMTTRGHRFAARAGDNG